MKRIVALLLTLMMLGSCMSFSLAETPSTEPETAETAGETEAEVAAEEGKEETAEDGVIMVPLVLEPDPALARSMGVAAATAVAYGVDPSEIVYVDHLSVGNPTEMKGSFFTELWGNATSDADVRDLLFGYNLIRWNGAEGMFEADSTVVTDMVGLEEEGTGNHIYSLILANDLYYSDGTRITAWDYAFSFLLTMNPVIEQLGGIRERAGGANEAILGSEAYMNGEANLISGIRVTADNAITITLDGNYLPYFYELALLSCYPYPISAIAPGVEVRDDGQGVYLANTNGGNNNQVLTVDLLQRTLNGENGYRQHPTVVSGPYTLTSWDGKVAEFARNSYYKGNANNEIPLIDRLTYTVADNSTMIEKLQNGEFDLLNKVAYTDAINAGMQIAIQDASMTAEEETEETEEIAEEAAPAAEATENSDFLFNNYPRSGLAYLGFATEKATVSSEAVRQAIAWCIDRDAITADYTGNYGLRTDGYLGIGQWMYSLALHTVDAPVEEFTGRNEETGLTYQETLDAFEKLSLDNLVVYTVDTNAAAALLDRDGWKVDQGTGLRTKTVNGETVTLDLKLFYPEGNRIGELLDKYMVPNLKTVGIGMTLQAVPMGEMSGKLYAQEREMDMFFMASNFDILYDPSQTFNPEDDQSTTRQQDQELYDLAVAMNETEPGNTLSYMQKWIAFQEKFNSSLPVIPLYTNVYFDFYTSLLHDYTIATSTTWGEAVVGAAMVSIPEYEIPLVPFEEQLEEGEALLDG